MAEWEGRRLETERARLELTARREYELQLRHAQKDFELHAKQLAKDHEVLLRQWKSEYAGAIRQDAIARSKAVIAGRVAENIAPFLPSFPFNPKDARFLGNPIDFVIFDGLDRGELTEIVFLEMKTESSRLSARQKEIREAIEDARVSWQELRLTADTFDKALPEVLFEDI